MKRLLLAAIFFYGTQLWARTILVPAEYPDIQAAINDANDGDTIIVGPGIYFENINFLGKSITLRSTHPDDPNVVANTVIDGSNSTDPNIGSVVTFANGEVAGSVLDGFTITGGTGSWLAISWEFKGLRWNRCGGGVVCYNMSAPTVTNNVFLNNTAGQGGGYYIYGDPVDPDDPSYPDIRLSPIIANNRFVNNSAVVDHGFAPPNDDYPNNDHGDGGAIVAFQGCDAVITGNSMLNNHADMYGGAIHERQWSNGLIEDNRIEGNDSALGAGIHITYISSPTIRDNLIRANTAGALGGGGIYVYYYSNPPIEQNIITQNTSLNGAGIAIYWESSPIVRNNLIYRNYSGAGIQIVSGSPTITHNTITHNSYDGIECRSGSGLAIENNIITSSGRGYGICVRDSSSLVIRYNNIWGNPSGACGTSIPDQTGINGNISVDPGFVDPDANDYHLNYSSRCINAADPNLPFEGLTDYDGDSRKLGQFADIGADESWPIWNITGSGRYENIQQAIDNANEGDVIVVTLGTHTGPGNRDIDFDGKAITVRSIEPNEPGVVAETIIDCQGSASEPHRGFYFRHQESTNSLVNGLTITNGGGAYEGGAIYCCAGSSPRIENCILTHNSAIDHGGAIACRNGCNAVIANCLIASNACLPRGYGGGIYCIKSSPVISNCIIIYNTATGSSRHGGGICCWDDSDAIVSNCFVAGNTAGHRGGGLYAYWSSPTFINCTVVGNYALEGGGVGSFSRDYIPERVANPTLINCIVRNNRSPFGPEAALINTLRIWGWAEHTEMTISHCNIQGGLNGVFVDVDCVLHWEANNIDTDPCFADAGYWDDANTPGDPNDEFFVVGDFHLLPVSPCVDSGDNSSIPPGSSTDLDEEERIFSDTVDIGADEVVTHPIDLNNDGMIDYLELILLTGQWLQSGQSQVDFHEDGFIDFLDYVRLADQWHWKGVWRR